MSRSDRSRFISPECKNRVISSYDDGGDWLEVAESLGVKRKTALTWIRRYKEEPSGFMHGGSRFKKLSDHEVDEMVSWIEDDPTITLSFIRMKLKAEYDKEVSITTIGNYLHLKLITLKKIHQIPVTMNVPENKEKRKK